MAFVSATAASSTSFLLSIPSAVRGSAGASSAPLPRWPLASPLRAAQGPNSAPVMMDSKVKKKKKGSGVGNLPAALDVEIREAQEYLDSDEQEPVPDNFPFEILDEEGMSVVILKRDYKDEKIEVIVSIPNLEGGPEYDDEDGEGDGEDAGKDDEDENEDESAGDSSASLKVTVSKGSGPKLEFTCTAFREEITIDDMLIVEKTNAEEEEKFPYEGPEFTELPVNVQKGLLKFLEQRGITDTGSPDLLDVGSRYSRVASRIVVILRCQCKNEHSLIRENTRAELHDHQAKPYRAPNSQRKG